MARPDLVSLELAVEAQTWAALGFAVDARGCSRIGGVELVLGVRPDAGGLTGWSLRRAAVGDDGIDGLATVLDIAEAPAPGPPAEHPNGATAIDHVVVATPDSDRTLAAFRAAGFEVRSVREGGGPERLLRQAFLLTGQALVEVVGPPEPAGEAPASFWGLTVAVSDLDAAAALLGSRLGEVRDAVQPGRRIATVRREAAAGLNLALMSPRPGQTSESNTRPG